MTAVLLEISKLYSPYETISYSLNDLLTYGEDLSTDLDRNKQSYT